MRDEQGRAQKGGIQTGTGLPATLNGDETCPVRMPSCRLTILLRAPRLGTVKSRLAAVLGDDAALAAYRELLERTLRAVSALALRQPRRSVGRPMPTASKPPSTASVWPLT